MSRILISGLINIETTVRVDGFPVTYVPLRYIFGGVRSTVSGVGYNIAKALTTLGNEVRFMSLIGEDTPSLLVRAALEQDHIPADFVLSRLKATSQSVIMYDEDGRRAIHVDLKDVQETVYPVESFEQAVQNSDLAVLCNVNFSRPFLKRVQQMGLPIATDVHTISDLDDDYNSDYMAAANLLFMSNEQLPCAPEEWAHRLYDRYGTGIIVIGLGAEGALLAVHDDNFMERIPARALRQIVNTIGAGDALFSSFVHVYTQTRDPYAAIQKAVLFAGYKIGATGAAEGFLTADRLEKFWSQLGNR